MSNISQHEVCKRIERNLCIRGIKYRMRERRLRWFGQGTCMNEDSWKRDPGRREIKRKDRSLDDGFHGENYSEPISLAI